MGWFLTSLRSGLGLSLLGLVALSINGCQKAPVKPPDKPPAVVPVDYPTERMVTETGEVTGRTWAVETIEVRARASGYLDKALFKDGDLVKAGQLLFEIDRAPYEAEVARSAAAVAQSKAHAERLRRQEERSRRLMSQKTISQDEFDVVLYDHIEAEAALKSAEALHKVSELNLAYTRITSRIDGRISRRLVDPGNMVKADETPLATIVSLDPIYAYFDIDERTMLRLHELEQSGRIPNIRSASIDADVALAGEDKFMLKGKVNFIDNQIEAGTGTQRWRLTIENPNHKLVPGMFVRVRIPIGPPRKVLVVPEEVLMSSQGERSVYIVDKDNKVKQRPVKIGILDGAERVIESGLTPSDRVIVTGLQKVKPGDKVNPKLPNDVKTEPQKGVASKSLAADEPQKPVAKIP